MRQGGKILARILNLLQKKVKPGVGTKELNNLAEDEIRLAGGWPAFKGYQGFPSALCTCLNTEIVHAPAIPNRQLKEGDILSLDLGIRYPAKNGLVVDAAITLPVGKVSREVKKLIETTRQALTLAIKKIKPGRPLGDVSAEIQKYAEKNSFNVIRDLVGHGVGYKVHEEPEIPNYCRFDRGPILEPGMTLAIEPMITLGHHAVVVDKNKHTYRMKDESLCAHFEHTVLVTERGSEILTKE